MMIVIITFNNNNDEYYYYNNNIIITIIIINFFKAPVPKLPKSHMIGATVSDVTLNSAFRVLHKTKQLHHSFNLTDDILVVSRIFVILIIILCICIYYLYY